ncbi:unnamed protein product [Discula destructiva]
MDGPTHLERVGPKGFIRYVFLFKLSEDYNLKEISRIYQDGYNATKKRVPAMNSEAVPGPEFEQVGVLKTQEIPEGDIQPVIVKDLRTSYPLTFAELEATKFPVSVLEADKICPGARRCPWPAPGDRLPLSQVQLNFIQSGVIVVWSVFHQFGDSVTWYAWAQIWAEECRKAQGLEITNPLPVHLPEEVFAARDVIRKPSGRSSGRAEDHPELLILPFTPEGMPPPMLSDTFRGQVFYFSPKSLAAVKDEASPKNATNPSPSDPTFVSTNDAISALLWRTVQAVQNPIESLGDTDPNSHFGIAVDGRARTDPPVHPEAQGCWLAYAGVDIPIRKLLTGSLADTAMEIRKSISKIHNNWTDEMVTLVDGLVDANRMIAKGFTDVPGINCTQTSWFKFHAYDLKWGNALGDRILAVRTPDVGLCNGLQVILPVPPEGGLEVLIGVEQYCMEKLLHEPLWNKFAETR